MQRVPMPPGAPHPSHQPFRAPAHKHAHHLHSIPPREKSTRTLIIDHLLWVHGRTRFAQARAELGMIDRTGGPSSANYAHRERPENFEEEEEVYSDGEDVRVLSAREGGPEHTHSEDEEEWLERQELALARALRQRAESVEKVATAMLDQPPEERPMHPDDLLEPPTSPSLQPQNARQHKHRLPNGVRLRLALATVINDFFSRRPPDPPQRPPGAHAHQVATMLPSSLVPLTSVSAAAVPHEMPHAQRKPTPSQYVHSLYATGSDPENANSPPSLRCPRHLHMSCGICVEAKSQFTVRPGGQQRGRQTSARASSATGSSPGDGSGGTNGAVIAVGVTGWLDGSGIGSGLARPAQTGTVLRRPSLANTSPGAGGSLAPTMHNTKLSELIPRFMRLSALVAMELGREATEDRASVDGGRDDDGGSAHLNGNAPPTPGRPAPMSPQTSPRASTTQRTDSSVFFNALRPSREWYYLFAGLLTRAVLEGYLTGHWRGIEPLEILLGVGLATSPPLARPQASRPADSGASGATAGRASGGDDPEFTDFDPDDLPVLDEAAKILFPSLREPMGGGNSPVYYAREGAELEYEIEMTERLARFYAVPQTTPDVATHMEDLAWQFPAEAVERAAVRFCEAVARWRGKPELETYKKAAWITNKDQDGSATATNGAMSIDALVHSNPASPSAPTSASAAARQSRSRRPPIEQYFAVPPSFALQSRKRRRSELDGGRPDEGRPRPSMPLPAFG
ncbi:uncharacterized protein BXZ73DRAFT_86668 [Epithele typhae]|uniref:uncharacterized protein n=1 Tax=Epithele typhae TaxID=378194 RepID=UPI0020072544|nr:uncharacterized protein BXZ73DRAFT_86668 [Epithele typhae]KAH9945110.1 hypothetical protein BXZ73DRAFT_86668 [Epithele typhae]